MDIFFAVTGQDWREWAGILIAAVLIGLSRTSISGFGILAVPVMAALFGGKASTGVILPMLITADIFAIIYFRRDADRKTLAVILPWALLGLVIGLFTGKYIDDNQFKMIIGLIVLLCLAILFYTKSRSGEVKVPDNPYLIAVIGIMTGFTSMVGNSAGPVFWIYLISKGSKKTDFLGTSAWFFFMMNITKLPLQILVWKNITAQSVIPALVMIPVVIPAALAGTYLIKKINEKWFEYLVLGMTAVAALNLVIF